MFRQPCKKVSHKLGQIPLPFGKSRRHLDCSSEKPDWKKSPERWKIPVWKPKLNFHNILFFQKLFFVRKFLWYVRSSFGNPSEYFWLKTTEKILTNSKNGYSTEFSTKTFLASKRYSGYVKRRFKKPAENMSPKNP